MGRPCYHITSQPYCYLSILSELNAGLGVQLMWKEKNCTDDCLVYLSEYKITETET
jgi:hypothetical protein